MWTMTSLRRSVSLPLMLSLVLLGCLGCAQCVRDFKAQYYDPPALPEDQVAFITADPSVSGALAILRIEGKQKPLEYVVPTTVIRLAPGVHVRIPHSWDAREADLSHCEVRLHELAAKEMREC